MRTFLNLSREECRDIYPVIEANAKSHFRAARILSKADEYALAIGHLILGTEEHLKAFAIFLDSRGFGVRNIDGMKGMFTSHISRHYVIKDFFTFFFVISRLFETFGNKDISNFKRLVAFVNEISTSVSFYKWWEQAENMKQKTFYVDYRDRLISPADLEEKDYNEALKHATRVKQDIRVFIMTVNELDEKELNTLKELFLTAKFDELLSKSVKKETKF